MTPASDGRECAHSLTIRNSANRKDAILSITDGSSDEFVGASLQQHAIALVDDLRIRYNITALGPFVESCRAALKRTDLSVGVLGRFKAGKSSFLNRLVGRNILPVGVLPVTAIVTDLAGGQTDAVIVRYADRTERNLQIEEISKFVSEAENPDNREGIVSVSVRVPELLRFGGIRLFDTPGLESAFAHNTEAAQRWAPNVDVALVAVAVDPPLTRQDLELIQNLLRYTPRVAVLLTKFDLLEPAEQREVLTFVNDQLKKQFDEEIEVFPWSSRSGYENLVSSFETDFVSRLREQISDARIGVVNRKIETLVRECGDYVRLSLKAAELVDSDRSQLRLQVSGEKNGLDDTKLQLRLVSRNAIGNCRVSIEKALSPQEKVILREVQTRLEDSFPTFPRSLDKMINHFQSWLDEELSTRLRELSISKKSELLQPFFDVNRQYARLLQGFRDRLSDRASEVYGVPLRTTEPEIVIEEPRAPDVKIGRVFDHSWELLSPILPMRFLRRAVFRRLRRKVSDETVKNISRLTSQWQEIVTTAVLQLQREAEGRIDDLVATVDRLTATETTEVTRIREDLANLDTIGSRTS